MKDLVGFADKLTAKLGDGVGYSVHVATLVRSTQLLDDSSKPCLPALFVFRGFPRNIASSEVLE